MHELNTFFPNITPNIKWMLEELAKALKSQKEATLQLSIKNGGIRNIKDSTTKYPPPKK